MTITPPHTPDDPTSHLSAIEMAWWASDSHNPGCPTCAVRYDMLPGPGASWLVEETHAVTCPVHEDYAPPGGAGDEE